MAFFILRLYLEWMSSFWITLEVIWRWFSSKTHSIALNSELKWKLWSKESCTGEKKWESFCFSLFQFRARIDGGRWWWPFFFIPFKKTQKTLWSMANHKIELETLKTDKIVFEQAERKRQVDKEHSLYIYILVIYNNKMGARTWLHAN